MTGLVRPVQHVPSPVRRATRRMICQQPPEIGKAKRPKRGRLLRFDGSGGTLHKPFTDSTCARLASYSFAQKSGYAFFPMLFSSRPVSSRWPTKFISLASSIRSVAAPSCPKRATNATRNARPMLSRSGGSSFGHDAATHCCRPAAFLSRTRRKRNPGTGPGSLTLVAPLVALQ